MRMGASGPSGPPALVLLLARLALGLYPGRPLGGDVADADPVSAADERCAEEAGLQDGPIQQALGRVAGHAETQFPEARALATHEGARPEALLEAAQLARRRRALGQIDEMHVDAALGEEALRLAGVRIVPEAEDLDGHAARARAMRSRRPAHAASGTAGVPGRLRRPVCAP